MTPQTGEIWQHHKTKGEYEIIGLGKLQVKDKQLDMCDCVFYMSLSDKKMWARPLADFTEVITNEKGEDVMRFIKIR